MRISVSGVSGSDSGIILAGGSAVQSQMETTAGEFTAQLACMDVCGHILFVEVSTQTSRTCT